MKYKIYIEEEDIENFKFGYCYLLNKIRNGWRLNNIDTMFIEIIEEYKDLLQFFTENKGELMEWEWYD